jgi:hypothetical protein
MPTCARRYAPLVVAALLGRFVAVCFLLLVGALGQAQAAAISFVQRNSADPQTPQTTVAVPYALAQTAGNLNVVVVGWNDSTAKVSSVVDSRGNVYALAAVPVVQSGTASQAIYYAKNIAAAAAGGNTVTVTFTVAAAYPDIRIAEYSGLDTVNPLDASAGAQGNSGTSDSGAVTTTNANDLLVGANLVQTTTTGPGTGFTNRIITSPDADILEDRVVTVAGSYNATATVSAGAWIMQIVAFRAAGSVPDTTPPTAPSNLTTTTSPPVVQAVQSYINSTALATHTTAPFNSSGGDLIVMCASSHAGVTMTPSDSFNNTWISAAGPTNTSTGFDLRTQVWYAKNPTVGAGHTFTLSLSAAQSLVISVIVVKGSNISAAPIDAISAIGDDGGSQTANVSSPNVTTTSGNDLLIGFAKSSVSVTWTPGNGYTEQVQATSNFLAAETGLAVLPGTYNATFTINGPATWQAVVAAVSPVLGGVSASQIALSWTASTDPDSPVSNYFVERCQGTGCSNFAQIAAPTGTTYTDTGLAPSTSYSYRVRATDPAGNLGGYSNVFTATTTSSGGTPNITATGGTPQSAVINTAFAAQLQATVRDAANNPLSGVVVTFTAPTSGASGTFAGGVNTATTNASGVATSATFTANGTAGGPYNVVASATGATSASFSLTNTVGPAAKVAVTSGSGQSTAINTAFGAPLVATVTDAGNNPVSGVVVTFTAPGSGASGTFAGGVNTATTNASGVATSATFTANATAGGPYNVVASATGATSANFSLTNLPVTAAIAFVQRNSADPQTPQTTVTVAYTAAQTAGNLNVVVVGWNDSTAKVNTVTDTKGNLYALAATPVVQSGTASQAIYYAKNIAAAAAGANTVTVTFTVAAAYADIRIAEYSGLDTVNPLDVSVGAQGNSATSNSGAVTTTNANDLLVGANLVQTLTSGAGTGYTSRVITSPDGDIFEDQVVKATGSYNATAPVSSGLWIMQMVAFKAAGSGPPPPVSVSVSPTSASVPTSGTQSFTAQVANDAQNKGVTWTLSGTGCSGSACGTLSSVAALSVTYNGPSTVPSPATVSLSATSVADNTKSASATITVTQATLNIAISPKRAAVTMSQTQQFTATVNNDPLNGGVTWSVDGNNSGNTTTGTVTSVGLFTPGTQAGSHTVTATSNSNASVSASVTIGVTDLVGVFTYHNDVARTGQNLKEYALTTATVNSSTFGQLFSCPVDGYVYAEPLYVSNLLVGATKRNVVYIATEHDSVFAFDADSPSCIQLWKTSFLGTGVTTMPSGDTSTTDLIPEIGITSTPVIDPATNTMYVEAKTKETVGSGCSSNNPCYIHRLHALDITSGSEKFGGPVVISGANFNSRQHFNRPALLLNSGTIYISFGSHGDNCPWQGWMFGYDPATLAQKFMWATTDPTSTCAGGAIWGGGAGPAVDASGNVYFSTGNGTYDGTKNFADTTVKLSSAGAILDWFTPFNQSTFDANDIDLGSAGVMILPDAVGSTAHPHLALATGKVDILYLLDQTNLGKFNSSSNQDVQEVIPVPPPNTTNLDGGNFGVTAYWNGNIYTAGVNFPLSQFHISNGAISTPQFAQSNNLFPLRGATPVVSASGTTNGVVWILDLTAWQTNGPAILDAYDATNVSNLLFSSPATGTGAAGPAVKFTVPTVANGKVYIGTETSFTVFGLLPN